MKVPVPAGTPSTRPSRHKKYPRVVGAFPDGQSALNLAAARLRHVASSEWSTKKYLSMEFLNDLQPSTVTA